MWIVEVDGVGFGGAFVEGSVVVGGSGPTSIEVIVVAEVKTCPCAGVELRRRME